MSTEPSPLRSFFTAPGDLGRGHGCRKMIRTGFAGWDENGNVAENIVSAANSTESPGERTRYFMHFRKDFGPNSELRRVLFGGWSQVFCT